MYHGPALSNYTANSSDSKLRDSKFLKSVNIGASSHDYIKLTTKNPNSQTFTSAITLTTLQLNQTEQRG
jgi:hypothetical protein